MTYRPKIFSIERSKLFKIVSKVQEAGSIALSKLPHFHRVYLATVCKRSLMAVVISKCHQTFEDSRNNKTFETGQSSETEVLVHSQHNFTSGIREVLLGILREQNLS